jgi:hypothetical protein
MVVDGKERRRQKKVWRLEEKPAGSRKGRLVLSRPRLPRDDGEFERSGLCRVDSINISSSNTKF